MKFRPARTAQRQSNCLELSPGEIEMAVKMRPNSTRTKRPYGALLYPGPVLDFEIVESRRDPDFVGRK